MIMSYKISNENGLQGPAWRSEYATQDAAAEAIRREYGWRDIVLSDEYDDDDETVVVYAYETQDECDNDDTGAHAPSITELPDTEDPDNDDDDESTPELTQEQLSALPFDATDDGDDGYTIINAAPDSDEYDGVTEPGSPWYEECDRRMARLQAALPPGWIAEWRDDDITISWSPDTEDA